MKPHPTTTALLLALALAAVGVLALVATRGRGSSARTKNPLSMSYDDLADHFREMMQTLTWMADEEREIRRWARSHKLAYLGAGAQRAVFAVPDGALKIAFDRSGFAANRNEAEVWEDAPPRIRRHLVPVLDSSGTEIGDGAWLLMEQVRASGRGDLSPEATELLGDCGIQDIVGQNVSDDGRLLDYGWVHRDAWGRCATPGSPTSNRALTNTGAPR